MEEVRKPNEHNAWKRFLRDMNEIGFCVGFRRNFLNNKRKDGRCFTEEEVILYNKETGIIVYAESFHQTHIKEVTVYGELEAKGTELNSEQEYFLSHCERVVYSKDTIIFTMGVVIDYKRTLEEMKTLFHYMNHWKVEQHLSFANYMERKAYGNDHREITKQKIHESSPEVRKIIFG